MHLSLIHINQSNEMVSSCLNKSSSWNLGTLSGPLNTVIKKERKKKKKNYNNQWYLHTWLHTI